MAKAGFWLRGAKGKLAGASMGKGANGQTIMREIVTPRNPKTNAQMIQRAIMATVMRAYSAGSEIFDHSFQGYAKGGNNQHRFVKLNANRLRSIIANDLNNAVELANQKGRVVAPGVQVPVAFEMIVSEGTYAQNYLTITHQDNRIGIAAPAIVENETVSQFCERNGLIPGDIYTAVFFNPDTAANRAALYETPGVDSDFGKIFNATFSWLRLKVKSSVLTDNTALGTKLLADGLIFDVEYSPNYLASNLEKVRATGSGIVPENPASAGVAVIRSREDQDLRSTSNMECEFATDGTHQAWGIASQYILDAWKADGQHVGNSEYILEGADAGRTMNVEDGGGD